MEHGERSHGTKMNAYPRLAAALAVSYAVMYAAMYARVDEAGHAFLGLGQAYMAGLMVAPMLVIMLLLMAPMYPRRGLNLGLMAAGALLAAGFFAAIRTQAAIGDEQFLRSMIPHHSGAILVCERADITDPRIKELCERIVESQRREIAEMREIMRSRR